MPAKHNASSLSSVLSVLAREWCREPPETNFVYHRVCQDCWKDVKLNTETVLTFACLDCIPLM